MNKKLDVIIKAICDLQKLVKQTNVKTTPTDTQIKAIGKLEKLSRQTKVDKAKDAPTKPTETPKPKK